MVIISGAYCTVLTLYVHPYSIHLSAMKVLKLLYIICKYIVCNNFINCRNKLKCIVFASPAAGSETNFPIWSCIVCTDSIEAFVLMVRRTLSIRTRICSSFVRKRLAWSKCAFRSASFLSEDVSHGFRAFGGTKSQHILHKCTIINAVYNNLISMLTIAFQLHIHYFRSLKKQHKFYI